MRANQITIDKIKLKKECKCVFYESRTKKFKVSDKDCKIHNHKKI